MNISRLCDGIFFKALFTICCISVLKIAEQLNVSLKTVEFHITKALRILRVELKDYLASILL